MSSDAADYRMGWPPGHFYSPLPSFREVRARANEIFDSRPRTLLGIDLNDAVQLSTFESLEPYFEDQPFAREKQPDMRFFSNNPNFGQGEALILQALMRRGQPKRVVEVGSGYSSCALLDIKEIFFEDRMQCTFIEPYPQLLDSLLEMGDRQRARVLDTPVQDVELQEFLALEAGDVVLIDSSHVSKVGSDVNHLLFEVLPSLRSGVYVHFHDIYFPFEYPERWIFEGRAWNEAYLLRAFLQFNSAFEIVFFNSYFARRYPDLVKQHAPLLHEIPGSSLWLRRL